jgi:ABC-2 type transport system permease protein
MLIILFAVSFIAGGLFFGFKGVSVPYLSYSNGAVKEVNMVGHILSVYGYNCVNLIMMGTFAFMISTVFRNSSIAIGLSIFLMFTGTTLVQLLSKYSWVKYILFANTNLRMYTDGVPTVKGMTLEFSIVVLIAYFLVFNLISWFGFSKRDVAA